MNTGPEFLRLVVLACLVILAFMAGHAWHVHRQSPGAQRRRSERAMQRAQSQLTARRNRDWEASRHEW